MPARRNLAHVGRVSGPMQTMIAARALALAAVAVLAVACASPAPSPSQSPGDPPSASAPGGTVDATGAWRLVEGTVGGAPILLDDQWPVTLTIEGTQIGGRAACNGYGGRVVVEGGVVRFGEIGRELIGCEAPVMATESAFLQGLEGVRQASMDGEILVLAGDGVGLRFEAIPPVPLAALLETTWRLDTLLTGEVASSTAGDPGRLVLHADGTFEGSTGCRTFSGRYVEFGGQIVATDMAMDDRVCPPALADQDGHVTGVLGDGFSAAVDGDRLTLTSVGGLGLVYVAAD